MKNNHEDKLEEHKEDYESSFVHMPELESLEAAEGVKLHPFFGDELMISYITFAPNAIAPEHQHPHEQITFIMEGRLEFKAGDQRKIIGPGDAVTIPSNVPHSAVALEEGCVCVDTFTPPREDFRKLLKRKEQN